MDGDGDVGSLCSGSPPLMRAAAVGDRVQRQALFASGERNVLAAIATAAVGMPIQQQQRELDHDNAATEAGGGEENDEEEDDDDGFGGSNSSR